MGGEFPGRRGRFLEGIHKKLWISAHKLWIKRNICGKSFLFLVGESKIKD